MRLHVTRARSRRVVIEKNLGSVDLSHTIREIGHGLDELFFGRRSVGQVCVAALSLCETLSKRWAAKRLKCGEVCEHDIHAQNAMARAGVCG